MYIYIYVFIYIYSIDALHMSSAFESDTSLIGSKKNDPRRRCDQWLFDQAIGCGSHGVVGVGPGMGAIFSPETHGKPMGKPWENHGKTMGKP